MKAKPIFAVLVLCTLTFSLSPTTAEAASIDQSCWFGSPPGTGPNPTIGCTMTWVPSTNPALYAIWSVLFLCVPSDCVVTNPPVDAFSITSPSSGTKHKFIVRNCYPGPTVFGFVNGLAKSFSVDFLTFQSILEQTREDSSGGAVENNCGAGGGSSDFS